MSMSSQFWGYSRTPLELLHSTADEGHLDSQEAIPSVGPLRQHFLVLLFHGLYGRVCLHRVPHIYATGISVPDTGCCTRALRVFNTESRFKTVVACQPLDRSVERCVMSAT